MHGDLAELLDAAEADGGEPRQILREDAFVDANNENVSRRAERCTVCWPGTRALKRQRS